MKRLEESISLAKDAIEKYQEIMDNEELWVALNEDVAFWKPSWKRLAALSYVIHKFYIGTDSRYAQILEQRVIFSKLFFIRWFIRIDVMSWLIELKRSKSRALKMLLYANSWTPHPIYD